ncbi:MAG: transposase [Pirellulaceae bacterium]
MPRRPRFAQAGYVFHVLNRGAGRQTLFESNSDYDAFVALIEHAKRQVPMRVLAYCVMPTHWHLVLWPETDDALSEYMRWLTVTHTQRWHARRQTAGTGPVYQGRFKSFPVQEDEHLLSVCRYVERNALRANLCTRAEHWKWSSAWAGGICPVGLCAWPVPKSTDWLAHVNEPQTDAELAAIRHSVIHGRPYGANDWVNQTARKLGLESTLRGRGRSGWME